MRTPFFALALALALGGACRAPSPEAGDRRVVRDGIGRQLRIPTRVRRVVSLAPSSTEILFAVGAGDRLVGVDRYSDWPPPARAVARVGADVDPSLERILGLAPDLVFTATSANSRATTEALERLGLPVFVSQARSLEEVYRDIQAIAEVVGHPAEGRAAASALRSRVNAVRARHRGAPRVRSLVVVWPDPLVVAGGAGTPLGEMIAAAGGENIAGDVSTPFPSYSVERMLARAPEVILVGTHSDGAPPLEALARLSSLPAVRNHRVHVLQGDLLFRPGPRLAEGLEQMEALLHPGAGGRR